TDGGHSWTKFRSDLDLPSNGNCMFSFINAEVGGKQFVLGSYASNKNARADGVIRVGEVKNGDIDWTKTYYINDGFYAYSCLTQLADGNIGLLYEGKADEVTYMVLSLDKDGNLSEINGNNFKGTPSVPSNEKTLRAFFGFFDKILSFFGLI
ncbi:MAG: exo-alpha-sialidase, partial [Clostridia bacterium]|nr:exo-alpha-sialidase [Clostridia bacterium]